MRTGNGSRVIQEMTKHTAWLLALAASLVLSRTATAQAPAPPPGSPPPGSPPPAGYYPAPMPVVTAPPPPLPAASLTISPIHLLMPVFELTAEFRGSEHLGLAVVGGAGSIKAADLDTRFGVYEVGGQVRYYLTGDFRRGLELGAELIYLHVSGSLGDVSGVGEGIGVGPFLGYKLGTMAGFVFDAQLGAERVGIAASSHDSSGSAGSASEQRWIPLLNLNIGWSF